MKPGLKNTIKLKTMDKKFSLRGFLIRLFILVGVALLFTLASCCREATQQNVMRWEKKHKFEKKVSYVKYPGKRKIKITY